MPARQRADGRVMKQVRYRDRDGKARRKSVYGRTAREAEEKAQEFRLAVRLDGPVRDSRRTLSHWHAEWSRTLLLASNRAESTQKVYQTMLRLHVLPVIGDLALRDVRPADVARVLVAAEDRLSASSRRSLYAALRALLEDAVSDGLLSSNPAKHVKRPKVPRREARHLTPEEFTQLLEAAQHLRYRRALDFMVMTGLRSGEARAARWEDVDLDQGTMWVRGTKTETSFRLIGLSPVAMAILKAQRAEQVAEQLATDRWLDRGLIFATRGGGPVDRHNLLRGLKAAAKRAGLDGVTVHTLRHSFATQALLAHAAPHVVSRTLGHSDVNITLSVYAHVTRLAEFEAVEAVAQAFHGPAVHPADEARSLE